MTNITPDQVAKIFNEAGVKIDSYSGRWMYGERCLSITEKPLVALHRVLETYSIQAVLEDVEDGEEMGDAIIEFVRLVRDYSEDQLGLGQIYYWPRMRWTEEMDALIGPGTFHDFDNE